jgi:hypothetical protein
MAYKQRWLGYFDALDADGSGEIDPGDLSYATKVFYNFFLHLFFYIYFIYIFFLPCIYFFALHIAD